MCLILSQQIYPFGHRTDSGRDISGPWQRVDTRMDATSSFADVYD